MHVVVRPHRISRGALAVMVVTAVVGVLATGVIHPSVAAADDPTPSCDATTCTVDFVPAGTVEQWSVPAGVSSVTVAMAAGSGASSAAGGVGGAGGADDGDRAGRVGRNVFGRCRESAPPTAAAALVVGVLPDLPVPGPGLVVAVVVVRSCSRRFPTSTVLLAVGGGGGAGGNSSEIAGAGGSNGAGLGCDHNQ